MYIQKLSYMSSQNKLFDTFSQDRLYNYNMSKNMSDVMRYMYYINILYN